MQCTIRVFNCVEGCFGDRLLGTRVRYMFLCSALLKGYLTVQGCFEDTLLGIGVRHLFRCSAVQKITFVRRPAKQGKTCAVKNAHIYRSERCTLTTSQRLVIKRRSGTASRTIWCLL